MSLPIHLQNIKSSGVYRFVYDKSVISGETAETLRLLVGYSDKGPFNTPVYITSREEFIKTYGNISKRLEKKGIYFHRLALQALAAGPILAMNLKPFGDESVQYTSFPASEVYNYEAMNGVEVTRLYDTNRFWTLDPDSLPEKISGSYISIFATDTEDASCSIIIRPVKPADYDLTIREWYAGVTDEMPDYLSAIQDANLSDYFADIYVFKGKFTKDLCGVGGPLAKYFNVSGDTITLEENYVDAFGEPADVLTALANDPASNYLVGYRGTSIPYFKNTAGSYISLDLMFNSGYSTHKMLMKLDDSLLIDGMEAAAINNLIKFPELDGTNHDMSDDVTTYYHKESVEYTTYSYTELTETPSEPDSYTTVTSLDDPVTADSPEHVKIVGDSTVYYDKTSTTSSQLEYVIVSNPTASIKKKAVEMSEVPTPPISDFDPAYIFVTTVGGVDIKPVYLKGFNYETEISVDSCLNVLTGDYGKGLQSALTNRVDSEYHYIVDTFDTAITNNKTVLAALAKKKDNAFAILNFPKVNDFKKDPTNFTNNTLDFKSIVKKFILPDDADGASWCGFFTQVVLSDGTVKTIIPSAGLVSNLFMDKWTSRQPYYIVAGSQFGRLINNTLVGPDYAFSKDDRDVLEPFGINCIVYEPRRGTYINSEQTAKQVPVSGLSKIHIRELVIYLQDEIADLLESYRWELNTQVLRDKIKAKADVILETVKNNNGVYDYLNVCDDSNNTMETIDNEFLVLDTHIEPSRGSGKMVEQLYIYRTGEMRSVLIQG